MPAFVTISNKIGLLFGAGYLISTFLGQGISFGKIYLFHFFTVSFGIYSLINWPKTLTYIKGNKVYYSYVLSFSLLVILSLLWNTDKQTSINPVAHFLLSFSVLGLVPLACEILERRTFLRVITSMITLHLALSLLETFNLVRWPISPYSEYKDLFLKDAVQDYNFLTIKNAFFAPATSFFWNPNNAAFVTMLLLPIISCFRDLKSKLVGYLVIFCLIFFSDSRSILILSLSFALISICLAFKEEIIKVSTGSVGLFLLLSADINANLRQKLFVSFDVFLGYINGFYYLVTTKLQGTPFNDLLVHEKIRERLVLLDRALDYVHGHYLFGRGAGFLSNKSFFYENRILQLSSIHNFGIEIFVEFGVVGLVMSLTFCAYLISIVLKANHRNIIFPILILALISLPVLSTVRYFLFFYLILGLIYFWSFKGKGFVVHGTENGYIFNRRFF